METNPNDYEPGIDQNQGVAGTMARNQQHGDTEEAGTQVPDLDPNLVTNQAGNDNADGGTDTLGEQEFVNDEGID